MSIQQRFLICPLYRQYLRDCKSLLKTVAIQCLRRFGLYVYFVQVPEPEMELNTEMHVFLLPRIHFANRAYSHDFGNDLGLGSADFATDTDMINTLTRLRQWVNKRIGRTISNVATIQNNSTLQALVVHLLERLNGASK